MSNEKYQRQTQELYALIGEFVVKFEMLCQHMRLAILMNCSDSSIDSKRSLHALMAEMAASQLLNSFKAVMFEQPNQTEFGRKLFSTLCNQIKILIEQRNEIVHGTHYIGWGNQDTEDWSSVDRVRMKITKDGLDFRSQVINEESMRPLIEDCDSFAQHVLGLASLLLPFPNPPSFEKNYTILDKKVVKIS